MDLDASLRAAARIHDIDFLPGAAELGDFDATSTTIALAPGGEQGRLPEPLLTNTFERYWTKFTDRRDGREPWKDYTPYEWRNVAAFVRLGWRERANEVREWFFGHRAPLAWNQWGEVVTPTPRTKSEPTQACGRSPRKNGVRGVGVTTSPHWFQACGARWSKNHSRTSLARSRQPRRTNAATLRHS